MNGTVVLVAPSPPPRAPNGQCALATWCALSPSQALATTVPQAVRFAVSFDLLVRSDVGHPGQYRGVATMGTASDGIAVFVFPPTGGDAVQLLVVAQQLRSRTGTILPAERNISLGRPTRVLFETGPDGSTLAIGGASAGAVNTPMNFDARDGIGLCGTSSCADALVRHVSYEVREPSPPIAPSPAMPRLSWPPLPAPHPASPAPSPPSGTALLAAAHIVGLTAGGALGLCCVTSLILWRARRRGRPARPAPTESSSGRPVTLRRSMSRRHLPRQSGGT